MITPHRLKISNGDGGARLKSVTKNIFREIARTKNRFFSIFTICAIGVGFFSGKSSLSEGAVRTSFSPIPI